MATERYHVGDRPKVFVQFTNLDTNEPEDPSVVELVIKKPDGSEQSVSSGFTHVADSGYYEFFIPVDQHGRWAGEWRGKGSLPEVEPWDFLVERSRLTTPVMP